MQVVDQLELRPREKSQKVKEIRIALPMRWRLLHSLVIKINRFRLRKASNFPFLSGETFASIVDYVPFGLNGSGEFDMSRVEQANSVFVVSDFLEMFLDRLSNSSKAPKVILTGNSDRNFEDPIALPEDVKVWFGQNTSFPRNSKSEILPLGLENITWGRSGQQKWFINHSHKRPKIMKVFVPPMRPTSPTRIKWKGLAEQNPEIFEVAQRMQPSGKYFRTVSSYHFTLCLEGNGFDTHRVWETLYLDSFPIVIRTPFVERLLELGLPLLAIDGIQEISQERLASFEQQNADFCALEQKILWAPYWKMRIEQHL